ncbi:hypothetical protein [Niveibacterium sp. SC-1]|uniref:hypothetical protein n=1 Tax=Niveibacterium sp. SC-1 TaxID=3135646 RepID=UPI00311F91A6
MKTLAFPASAAPLSPWGVAKPLPARKWSLTVGVLLSLCANCASASPAGATADESGWRQGLARLLPWPHGDLYTLGLNGLLNAPLLPLSLFPGAIHAITGLHPALAEPQRLERSAGVRNTNSSRAGFYDASERLSWRTSPTIPTVFQLASSATNPAGTQYGAPYDAGDPGVEWQAGPNSMIALEQGRIRVRLYSFGRSQMSMRIKGGGPMLTYRLKFD